MILTLVPNPALDKTVVIKGFKLGEIHRPSEVLTLAGGKGFNFARALKTLGQKAMVICPAGGFEGQRLRALADADGLDCDCLPVKGELRTCLTVLDPASNKPPTEIYEKGLPLDKDDWKNLLGLVRRYFPGAGGLAVCGSFPPGVSTAEFKVLLRDAKAARLPFYLDTYGPHLKEALPLTPTLVKINQFETGDLVGRMVNDPATAFSAAKEIQAAGAQQVVITLGKQGAVGITQSGETFGWAAPQVAAVSAVGSGDSFFAGLVAGLLQGQDLREAARLGIAAGAANTLQIGAGRFELFQVEKLVNSAQPVYQK